jgi:hypothetical protein
LLCSPTLPSVCAYGRELLISTVATFLMIMPCNEPGSTEDAMHHNLNVTRREHHRTKPGYQRLEIHSLQPGRTVGAGQQSPDPHATASLQNFHWLTHEADKQGSWVQNVQTKNTVSNPLRL